MLLFLFLLHGNVGHCLLVFIYIEIVIIDGHALDEDLVMLIIVVIIFVVFLVEDVLDL